ncbi:MAG: hypothetical protein ACR2OC_00705 [Solirubrobacterales bacterium]
MPNEIPIACTLTESERPERAASAAGLGADALVGLEVSGPRATLRFAGEQDRVEALVAAERSCCAFFEFELVGDGEQTELEVRAPEGADWAVRGLVAGLVAGWERLA